MRNVGFGESIGCDEIGCDEIGSGCQELDWDLF